MDDESTGDPILSDDEKVDPMLPVYFLIIYFSIYTVFGFVCSFISESSARRQRRSAANLCMTWSDNMGEWREYYHSFALHVLDESTTISAIISMYCVCEDLYGTDISDWRLITRQPKPGMLLLLSTIIWLLYKLGSLLYLISIDIFSWLQVFLHLIDCNYLYEMFIAHSQKNKNPIIQWMHRQYIYFCSIPLWFLSFVFLLRWSVLFEGDHNNPLFVCILLSNLFGLLNIFYVLLWCDQKSFTDECKRITSRGFRLRFAYRGCQFISRMVWYGYFWIFLGSGPFFILSLIMFINHIYLYFRGYLGEIYYIITKFFIIPDMSIGIGYRNSQNHKKVGWITKIIYILTHCAGCIIGIWVIAEEDLLYIDMLAWLHWFEDLILWAVITGICDQQPMTTDDTIMGPPKLWDAIWTEPRYEAFYALGIITWFFGGSYYLVLRIEDFIDRNKQSLSITQGILGLAENGQWDSLDKFLPRMKKISINRKNILDGNKTAIHYAIQQEKWKIVKKLMQYGANVNIQDRNHQTGVHLVCLNKGLNDIVIFRKFLNAFDGDPAMKRDNNGKTLLHLICQNNSNNLALEERLKCYFQIFGKEDDKKKEIDVNIADNDGCTPLHYLCQECNEQNAIQLLIEYGANINIVDNKQRTALIHAVSKNENNPTTIRYLLSNGANINHQDDKGWTPLHFAVSSNLTDNVFILLEYFPNITIRNNAGKNAYNLAESMGHSTIADTLKMNMPIEELIEIDPNEMKQRLENERKQREKEKEEEQEKMNQTMTTNGDNKQEEEEEDEDGQVVIEIEEENTTNEKNKGVMTNNQETETLEISEMDDEDENNNDDKKDENNPLLSEENAVDNKNNNNKDNDDEKGNEENRTITIDINDDDDNDPKLSDLGEIDEAMVRNVSQHIDLADDTPEAYQD